MAAIVVLGALSTATTTQAADVSFGSLTRDTSTDIISDSLNQRLWLSWTATAGMTLSQIEAATAVGGRFAGYTIADATAAQAFAKALLGPGSACTGGTNVALQYCATGTSPNLDLLTGENEYNTLLSKGYDLDLVMFKSDGGSGWTGYMATMTLLRACALCGSTGSTGSTAASGDATPPSVPQEGSSNSVFMVNTAWGSANDGYSTHSEPGYVGVGWLLYQSYGIDASAGSGSGTGGTSPVPEPGGLGLMLCGLLPLASRSLRRQLGLHSRLSGQQP